MVTPAQFFPPPAKRKKWPFVVGAAVLGVLLCCGGVTVVGLVAGDPAKPAATAPRLVSPVSSAPAQEPAAAATTTSASAATTVPTSPVVTAPVATSPVVTVPTPARTTSKPATVKPKPRPTTAKPTTTKPTTRAATKKPATKKPTTEPAEVYYANCTAVRAAGADPIRRGDPGYSRKLDRDGDGVACE